MYYMMYIHVGERVSMGSLLCIEATQHEGCRRSEAQKTATSEVDKWSEFRPQVPKFHL